MIDLYTQNGYVIKGKPYTTGVPLPARTYFACKINMIEDILNTVAEETFRMKQTDKLVFVIVSAYQTQKICPKTPIQPFIFFFLPKKSIHTDLLKDQNECSNRFILFLYSSVHIDRCFRHFVCDTCCYINIQFVFFIGQFRLIDLIEGTIHLLCL